MKKLIHRLAHLFGLNKGRVASFWLDDELWIGHRCDGCDEINGAHRVDTRLWRSKP